jgi:glycosyltransferase involved in cell wall biosynthesis
MHKRHRVLFVATHPVQYQAPMFRHMAQNPRLDFQVAYCDLQGSEAALDHDFGVQVKWDVPLLEDYPWVHVPNWSPRPAPGRFFGLVNPGLWELVRTGGYDAVVIYTGYACVSFWIALVAAKLHRKVLFFATDAHELRARDGKHWKSTVKRFLWPWLFRLASVVILPSSKSVALMRRLGIPDEHLVLTPYAVDNDWWIRQADDVDWRATRRVWGVPEGAPVALFCAKLQPWKRPMDLLLAFAKANVSDSRLVYAGDGPLRHDLESQARSLGLASRVHFLGFTNQSQLPAIYRASNLLVLPSEYEPFGVVVNEAMLCGCSVIVSDRVGAGGDLVSADKTGLVFPCGDIERLASILNKFLQDRPTLRRMGEAARCRMATWSPAENIEALIQALDQASHRKKSKKSNALAFPAQTD